MVFNFLAEFWFHGTLGWRALDIANTGINLSFGASHQDFSNGSGYFISDDLKVKLILNCKFAQDCFNFH